jgi:long-chain acyl-CoA synthetase
MSLNLIKPQTRPSFRTYLEQGWQDVFLIDALTGETYTKRAFFQMVATLLEKLQEEGLEAGDSLVVVLENSTRMAALFFACMLGQIVFIPIDPNKGPKEFEDILNQVNAKAHLGRRADIILPGIQLEPDRLLGALPDQEAPVCLLEQLSNLSDHIDNEQVSLVTFTSGSTGIPKGVCHSFSNLIQAAEAFNAYFGFNQAHRFYHHFPMSYMAGLLNSLVLPFIAGSQVIIGERFGVSKVHTFWKHIIASQANVLWLNPTMLSLLLKLDRASEGVEYSHKNTLTGLIATAPLPEALKNCFKERYGLPLFQSYGLSETLFVSTNHPHQTAPGNSIGYLLPGAEVDFVPIGEHLDPELLIQVPWMFKGYLNADTATYFDGRFYRSGDLGRQAESGALLITGRQKDIIIRGGTNISPRRLEEFLLAQELVEDCAVIGLPDPILGEKLILAYVAKQGTDFDSTKNRVLSQVTEQFGPDYRIDQFIPRDALPMNSNGKLDRTALQTFCASSHGQPV